MDAFRLHAAANDLVFRPSLRTEGVPHHYFDLNEGPLHARPEAVKVKKLVELAMAHANSAGFHEHAALLHLVAERLNLERLATGELLSVLWCRPYHVRQGLDPKKWISLESWLADNGCVPGS